LLFDGQSIRQVALRVNAMLTVDYLFKRMNVCNNDEATSGVERWAAQYERKFNKNVDENHKDI